LTMMMGFLLLCLASSSSSSFGLSTGGQRSSRRRRLLETDKAALAPFARLLLGKNESELIVQDRDERTVAITHRIFAGDRRGPVRCLVRRVASAAREAPPPPEETPERWLFVDSRNVFRAVDGGVAVDGTLDDDEVFLGRFLRGRPGPEEIFVSSAVDRLGRDYKVPDDDQAPFFLGRGAAGLVLRCSRRRDKSSAVAVKLIRATTPDALRSAETEVRIMTDKLQGALRVARLVDVVRWTHENNEFTALAVVSEPVGSSSKVDSLTDDQLASLLETIDDVHARGVVHGDLCVENVVLVRLGGERREKDDVEEEDDKAKEEEEVPYLIDFSQASDALSFVAEQRRDEVVLELCGIDFARLFASLAKRPQASDRWRDVLDRSGLLDLEPLITTHVRRRSRASRDALVAAFRNLLLSSAASPSASGGAIMLPAKGSFSLSPLEEREQAVANSGMKD